MYSKGTVSHDPVRIQELSTMRRPQTSIELTQFLQASNWFPTPLPRMSLLTRLRVFFEQLMTGASRWTKRVACNRVIPEDALAEDRVRAGRAA